MKKGIENIEQLIQFISDRDLTNDQINELCSYTLNRGFVSVGDVDKVWFIDWLQNYKEKYHHLQESEKPFIINANMPFDITEIYQPKSY